MATNRRAAQIAAVLGQLAELLTEQQRSEIPTPRVSPRRTLLTVEEAAELLHIGKTKTYALVKSGDLDSVMIGRLRRIHIDAVNEYAARLVAEQQRHDQQPGK
jgi:excisionase family DNA binding protein